MAGDGFVAPVDGASTLEEWLDHPDGGPLLRNAMTLEDPDATRMLGQFRLETLATFGLGFGPEDLAAMVARLPRVPPPLPAPDP